MKSQLEKFKKNFQEKERTMLVLTAGYGPSGGKAGGDTLWNVTQKVLAYIDCETDELIKADGQLEWMAQESQKKDWIYDLKGKTIYRIKARKRNPGKTEDYQKLIEQGVMAEPPAFEHHFKLVEVLERELCHPDLLAVLKEYEQPVIIEDPVLGEFELNKELNIFEGAIEWLGNEVSVIIDQDAEEADSATDGLKRLRDLVDHAADWDQKMRAFAAEKLVELANDWLQDSDEQDPQAITAKDFAERIELSELSIAEEGEFSAYYNDDDMFWGHIIIIEGNDDGEFSDAYIAG